MNGILTRRFRNPSTKQVFEAFNLVQTKGDWREAEFKRRFHVSCDLGYASFFSFMFINFLLQSRIHCFLSSFLTIFIADGLSMKLEPLIMLKNYFLQNYLGNLNKGFVCLLVTTFL